MILPALFFYLFAGVCVASAVMVIVSRNPVHSVLFLILAFVNASGLFVLMGAEFLAMILVVVYVGAVAVLFLFVIMMLDVDFTELREGFLEYLPIGLVIGISIRPGRTAVVRRDGTRWPLYCLPVREGSPAETGHDLGGRAVPSPAPGPAAKASGDGGRCEATERGITKHNAE